MALAEGRGPGCVREGRAFLEKAIAAVKGDKAKALDEFNNGTGGFKDRDLYVFLGRRVFGE